MIKRKSIAFKLIFSILFSCSVLFLAIFSYHYFFSKEMIVSNITEHAKTLTRATVNEIDSELYKIQKIAQGIASFLEYDPYDKDELLHMIYSVFEHNPEIYGVAVSFEPYAFDPKSLYFSPCYYREENAVKLIYQGSEDYNYFSLDWYQIPKELNAPVWSEPYYDEGGENFLMATYSVPFYKNEGGQKKFMGIVNADISLEWLQKRVSSIKIAKSGYGVLISKNGTYVTHPFTKFIMNETIFSIAEAINDKQLHSIGRSMIKGESRVIPFTGLVTKKASWISYAPLLSSGWSLGIVFPCEELLSDIKKLNRMVLILGFLGLVILFIILFSIATSITRPIGILADITRDIGKGKLDFDLSAIKSHDEVGMLAESFVYMRNSLRKYIQELTETMTAKERMQSELQIAHNIQMGIIPKVFPPFPDRPEFDIYGTLEPAKEVGGDFYDFFFMDNDRLCFVIGDVSGKGVPAAIFMAVTKTMIKAVSKGIATPDEILDRVNKEIAHDNESSMFVTIFCAILHIGTGEILYSNGGHLFPLIARYGGGIEFLKGYTGMAAGASEKSAYKSDKIRLNPGDALFLYTDGVTEAVNKEQKLFGPERLKETVSAARYGTVKEIVSEERRNVCEFSKDMPQADDITMLAVQYFGSANAAAEETIMLKNSASEIPRLTQAVYIFAKSRKIPDRAISEITLALEEILVNIQSHAYADKKDHDITVALSLAGAEFAAKIVDDGRPFDPAAAPRPDINAPLEERKAGGLGLHFVRKFMDKVEYKREGGKNILVLRKKI